MKVLYWHVDYLKYEAVKKALKLAPDLSDYEKKEELKSGIVALITFEKEDNEMKCDAFIEDLKNYAKQINATKVMLYPYAHLSKNLLNPQDSMKLLNLLKIKLQNNSVFNEVKFSPFGWYKSFEVKVKGHPLAELSREF